MAVKKPSPSLSERILAWVMAGLGIVLVVGALVVVLKDVGATEPASITVRETQRRAAVGGGVVTVEVFNHGDGTAGQVHIEGELMRPGTEPEMAEAVIDYVPGHSRAEASLAFTSDPTGAQLTVRTKGWTDP